jgi:hypothetical protein
MPKTFPGNFDPGTPHHYDAYAFTNPFEDTCLTIDLLTTFPGFQVFSAAYLGSFDPTDISTNYLADSGFSAGAGAPVSYEFHVLTGQSFVVVISEVIPDRGVADYSFTLTQTTTPDSGTTAALLGLALTGLAGFRARFGRH